MKEVAPHDRPREKLERLGASALGDNELLALVLGSGSRARDVLGMANVLLEQRGGLHGLTRSTAADLRLTPGVGQARAAQVLAAVDAARRAGRTSVLLLVKPGQGPEGFIGVDITGR